MPSVSTFQVRPCPCHSLCSFSSTRICMKFKYTQDVCKTLFFLCLYTLCGLRAVIKNQPHWLSGWFLSEGQSLRMDPSGKVTPISLPGCVFHLTAPGPCQKHHRLTEVPINITNTDSNVTPAYQRASFPSRGNASKVTPCICFSFYSSVPDVTVALTHSYPGTNGSVHDILL